MKKVLISIVIILVVLLALGWYFQSSSPRQENVYFDQNGLSMQTYTVNGKHTGSGVLIVPFKKDLEKTKFINVMLAGRWISKNIPLTTQDGRILSFSFDISSLAVSAFDVQLLLTDDQISGSDWDNPIQGASYLDATVKLAATEIPQRDCLTGVNFETQMVESSGSDLYLSNCVPLVKASEVISLNKLSDVEMFNSLKQALAQGQHIALLIAGDQGAGHGATVNLVNIAESDGQRYILVADPMIPSLTDVYRLENGLLKAFSTILGDSTVAGYVVAK